MSPEIIFGTSPTSAMIRELWHDSNWQKLLLAIVVDEVHCIRKWGDKFRPQYDRLGELRLWAPGVPFLGLTATITEETLGETMDKLFLNNAKVLRVEELPTNVRIELYTQPKDARLGLCRFLNGSKTIIYFEKICTLLDVFNDLKVTMPELRDKIDIYYSTLTTEYKADIMAQFVKSDSNILLATEAAGMGCDIPDVVQVIQYG